MSDIFHIEANRQGVEYSKRIKENRHRFFEDIYWDFTRQEKVRWMLRKIFKYGAAYLPDGISLLDVGCGIGFATLEVARHPKVKYVKGVDVSSEALAIAETLKNSYPLEVSRKVYFKEQNFFDVEDDNSFDCVYLHEVFEHIPPESGDAVFRKAERLIKSGGFLMISTPNYDRLMNRLLDIVNKKRWLVDNYHLKEYTISELARERENWEVVCATGRGLFDEFALSTSLSCGVKFIHRLICLYVKKFHATLLCILWAVCVRQ